MASIPLQHNNQLKLFPRFQGEVLQLSENGMQLLNNYSANQDFQDYLLRVMDKMVDAKHKQIL